MVESTKKCEQVQDSEVELDEEEDSLAQQRRDLLGYMAVIKAQLKDANIEYNSVDPAASREEKEKAKRKFEALTKECEDGLIDAKKRLAVYDCLEAYKELIESKAYI